MFAYWLCSLVEYDFTYKRGASQRQLWKTNVHTKHHKLSTRYHESLASKRIYHLGATTRFRNASGTWGPILECQISSPNLELLVSPIKISKFRRPQAFPPTARPSYQLVYQLVKTMHSCDRNISSSLELLLLSCIWEFGVVEAPTKQNKLGPVLF